MKWLVPIMLTFGMWTCGGTDPGVDTNDSPLVGAWRIAETDPDDVLLTPTALPVTIRFYGDSRYKGRYTATGGIEGRWSVRSDELTLDDGQVARTYKFGVGGDSLSIRIQIGDQEIVVHLDRVEDG